MAFQSLLTSAATLSLSITERCRIAHDPTNLGLFSPEMLHIDG